MATPIFDEEAAKRLKAAKAMAIQSSAVPAQQPGAAPAAPLPQSQKAAQAAQISAAVGQQAAQQTTQLGQAAIGETQLQLQQKEMQDKQRMAEREIGQKVFLGDADILQGLQLGNEKRQAEERLTTAELDAAKRVSRLGLETDANLSFLTRSQREQLGALGADVKEKIFDSRLQFQKSETGRKFSNERQLRDYAIVSAKTESELENKLMTQKLLHQRGIQMMEVAQNKVNEALRQSYGDKGRELTQQSQEHISNIKSAAERAAARKRRNSSNMSSIIVGVFTIGGAILGMPAGPAGVAAGATLGGAVGGVVDGQTKKE